MTSRQNVDFSDVGSEESETSGFSVSDFYGLWSMESDVQNPNFRAPHSFAGLLVIFSVFPVSGLPVLATVTQLWFLDHACFPVYYNPQVCRPTHEVVSSASTDP